MGLLDNNSVLTTPKTGLEGTAFVPVFQNQDLEVFQWDQEATGRSLVLSFRDIYAWIAFSSADKLYLVKGKITDAPTEIAVNSTNFPGLRGTPSIARVIACPCDFFRSNTPYSGGMRSLHGRECRVCVIFSNGQIYHNYPSCHDTYDFSTSEQYNATKDLFHKFSESVVWDLPNRKHPVKTQSGDDATLIATGAYYYNPALPDKCYEFHPALNSSNGYGNTVGFPATNNVNIVSRGEDIGTRSRFFRTDMDSGDANSFDYMGGYVAFNMYTLIGTYRSNEAEACRICMFGTQDGGRSWYCMYEFASRDRIKYSESLYKSPEGVKGIVLSQDGESVGSGVYTVARRSLIVPYATVKEPANKFELDGAIEVASIVGADGKVTVTTSTAHGYSEGDAVFLEFQTGVTANDRAFDWMVNGGVTANSGGNGILFKVVNKTTTAFDLALYVHSTENNLPARHIHSLNKCRDGVVIGAGETYPTGGWILFNPVKAADSFDAYNVANAADNPIVRLNSTSSSAQRPVGCIVQQEGEDTYVYFASDESSVATNDVEMPSGRTQSFNHSSVGIFKIKLSDIDDFDKALVCYPSDQVSFGFQKHGGAMVFFGENGDLGISFDDGKTWTSVQVPSGGLYRSYWGQSGCHFSGLADGKAISLNNLLIRFNH